MDDSVVRSKPEPVVVGLAGGANSRENGGVGNTTLTIGSGDEIRAVVPFYMPLGFFWLMIIWAIVEGSDDEVGCGMMIVLPGFIASIVNLRLEFFKGFVLNIGLSVIFSFIAFILGSALHEPDGVGGVLILISIISSGAVLPVWLHKEGVHVRALGSAYAMPICIFIIVFGLLFGMFGWPN